MPVTAEDILKNNQQAVAKLEQNSKSDVEDQDQDQDQDEDDIQIENTTEDDDLEEEFEDSEEGEDEYAEDEIETQENVEIEEHGSSEAEIDGENQAQVTIELDGEPIEQSNNDTGWIKDLRRKHREATREVRELKRTLESLKSQDQSPQTLGKYPELSDFDFNEAEYRKALDSYYERKLTLDMRQKQIKEMQERKAREWESKVKDFQQSGIELAPHDFEETITPIESMFGQTENGEVDPRYGIIIQGAENPAHVAYVLGKDIKTANRLKSITDPIKFATEIGRLEKSMNIRKKTGSKKVAPESRPRKKTTKISNAKRTQENQSRLAKKAFKTGDFSDLIAARKNGNR